MLVFDASTLIVLSDAKLLGLVLDTYDGDVVATETTAREATRADTEGARYIRGALEDGRLGTRQASAEAARVAETYKVERGEAEAIAVALEAGGALVATDDGRAMRACKAEGVAFAPAASFVVRAREKELIPEGEAHAKLEEMERHHGYQRAIIEDAHHRVTGGSAT